MLLILRRSVRMTKEEWRTRATRRTLGGFDFGPVVLDAWREMPAEVKASDIVQVDVEGRAESAGRLFRRDGERVVLSGKTLFREIGIPKRVDIPLGPFKPWEALRIIVNGRQSFTSGQLYWLRDYHIVLCEGTAPESLGPARIVDLQADLM